MPFKCGAKLETVKDCGEIASIRFKEDMNTGAFRNYGDIDFVRPEATDKAVELLGPYALDVPVWVEYTTGSGRKIEDATGAELNCLDVIDKRTGTTTVSKKDIVFICPTCDKAIDNVCSLKGHYGAAHQTKPKTKLDVSKVKVGLIDSNGAVSRRFDSIEDLERGLACSKDGCSLEIATNLGGLRGYTISRHIKVYYATERRNSDNSLHTESIEEKQDTRNAKPGKQSEAYAVEETKVSRLSDVVLYKWT